MAAWVVPVVRGAWLTQKRTLRRAQERVRRRPPSFLVLKISTHTDMPLACALHSQHEAARESGGRVHLRRLWHATTLKTQSPSLAADANQRRRPRCRHRVVSGDLRARHVSAAVASL